MSTYPRLSPDGRHVARGFGRLLLNEREIGSGYAPAWVHTSAFVYGDGRHTFWHPLVGDRHILLENQSIRDANGGGGLWAGVVGQTCLFGNDQQVLDRIPQCGWGVVAPDGTRGWIPGWSTDKPVVIQGLTVHSGVTAVELRATTGLWVWRVGSKIFGYRQGRIAQAPRIGDQEFWPIPIWVNGEHWLLTHDSRDRLLLRPFDSTFGYIVTTGTTHHPDAVALNSGVRAVWDRGGALGDRTLTLTSPRINLLPGLPPEPKPPIPPEPPPMPTPTTPPKLSEVTWLKPHASGENPLPWSETARVKSVSFTSSQTCVNHTKLRQWPVHKPESKGGIDANLCVVAFINGRWYAWPCDYIRPGNTCMHAGADKIGGYSEKSTTRDWKPKKGELVGLFMSAPCRDDQRTIRERSNIVWPKWGHNETFNIEEPTDPTEPTDPPEEPGEPQEPTMPVEHLLLQILQAIQQQTAEIKAQTKALTRASQELKQAVNDGVKIRF